MASESTQTQRIDLNEAEELACSLGEALSSGDCEGAVELCRKLSILHAPVCVSIKNEVYPQDPIRLKVGVEDAESDCYVPTTVVVSAAMTIAQLKEKICHDFGFHPLLQRWVIGKRLAQDQKSLHSYGIRKSGDQAFLFILSAHAAHLTRHQHKLDQEQQRIESQWYTQANAHNF